MRIILTIATLILATITASAGERYHYACETYGFSQQEIIGQRAYRDPCFYGSYVKKPAKFTKKRAARFDQMAYKNPPASQIYNHPARGMKHKRDDESVNLHVGTPRAYQLLGTSLFYGPYMYSPRDRELF